MRVFVAKHTLCDGDEVLHRIVGQDYIGRVRHAGNKPLKEEVWQWLQVAGRCDAPEQSAFNQHEHAISAPIGLNGLNSWNDQQRFERDKRW